ncbi:MAG: protease complex subunit PrcB family protein [Sinobacteraceae bacterium]|nr:protease complex subunit PrcB family protein [Nevskiaceae bacterium]
MIAMGLAWAYASSYGGEPAISPIEHQTFRPNLYFSSYHDGPDTALFTAIRSEGEWKALWSQLEPRMARDRDQRGPHSLPPIDFTRKILLVAALGMKMTGGYTVSIDSVVEEPAGIRVNAVGGYPGKKCVLLQAVTHPIALALIPRTSKRITFNTTEVEHSCE